jgi:hypothetical protein
MNDTLITDCLYWRWLRPLSGRLTLTSQFLRFEQEDTVGEVQAGSRGACDTATIGRGEKSLDATCVLPLSRSAPRLAARA